MFKSHTAQRGIVWQFFKFVKLDVTFHKRTLCNASIAVVPTLFYVRPKSEFNEHLTTQAKTLNKCILRA